MILFRAMGRLYWSALILLCSIECGSIYREFVEEKGKRNSDAPHGFSFIPICVFLCHSRSPFPLLLLTRSFLQQLIPLPRSHFLSTISLSPSFIQRNPQLSLPFKTSSSQSSWPDCGLCVHTCACMGVGLPAYNCRQNISIFMISLCWCIVGVSKCKC